MGKSKKTKSQKPSRNNASSCTAGPLIDKLLPKGLKGTIFWKSNVDKTTAARTDDQASTGTLSSQGSAVNVASAAASGSTHNMLPPLIPGAQKLNSDSAKSVASSGYGSMPGSTRNSVVDASLPPVPGHFNIFGSDSDIVHKCSPETSPLAAKKYSTTAGYRQSREETTGRVPRNSRPKMSVVSTYSMPSWPSVDYYTPMTITQLVHRQSSNSHSTSPSQVGSHDAPRVVKISQYEYSLTSASGHTNIEIRESKPRNRKLSDVHSKKTSGTNRPSIISLPPLNERDREPNPRPQRSSYSFNTRTHTENENNLVVTANRLSITSNNFNRRSSITSHASDVIHRRPLHRISITSVDDGRIPASNGPPAIIEEPVQPRPTSKRRYGTIMLESPRPNVIQLTDDHPAQATRGRRESLVVPGVVPQIIFISPTPDPSHGTSSPSSSSSTSPSERH